MILASLSIRERDFRSLIRHQPLFFHRHNVYTRDIGISSYLSQQIIRNNPSRDSHTREPCGRSGFGRHSTLGIFFFIPIDAIPLGYFGTGANRSLTITGSPVKRSVVTTIKQTIDLVYSCCSFFTALKGVFALHSIRAMLPSLNEPITK